MLAFNEPVGFYYAPPTSRSRLLMSTVRLCTESLREFNGRLLVSPNLAETIASWLGVSMTLPTRGERVSLPCCCLFSSTASHTMRERSGGNLQRRRPCVLPARGTTFDVRRLITLVVSPAAAASPFSSPPPSHYLPFHSETLKNDVCLARARNCL